MIIPKFIYNELIERNKKDAFNNALDCFETWVESNYDGYRKRIVSECLAEFRKGIK